MKFKNPPITPSLCWSALALGILSTTTGYAQVVAGWDTWDSPTAPFVSVLATGVDATASASGGQGNWTNNDSSGRGSSDDTTWGSYSTGVAASTITDVGPANFTLTNAKTDGEITFTIFNDGVDAVDLDLGAFNFDAVAFRPKAARTYELEVLSGSDITEGIVFTSEEGAITSLGGGLSGHSQHDEIDIDLTGLADSTLEIGGTAIFQLRFTGGAGDGSGGHHLFLDNVAVTLVSDLTNKLAVTSVPATATAGSDFSVTVEAQDVNGNPLNVSQDTEISLSPSGSGTLTGNTATILSGTSSVTLSTVQYTAAEDITLAAAQTSGDPLLLSEESTVITVSAGLGTELTIETESDGSGSVVGDMSAFLGNPFEVFAISRDSSGNFVDLETAAEFSLINITGEIDANDLFDNFDGSATFTPNLNGTANISAAVEGFTDAVSGLITVADLVNRYDGGTNSSPNWSSAIVWEADTLPFFDNQTDIFLFEDSISKRNHYLGIPLDGIEKSVRSVNFNEATTGNLIVSYVQNGLSNSVDLIFDTDSTTEPAEFNVDAICATNITFGGSNGALPEAGQTVLADDLLVTHNGTGYLRLNSVISEMGGSYGITKAGTGTLELLGDNTYTGTTTVSDGILFLDGNAINDSGTLVVEGTGQVEVAFGETESVTSLIIGGVAQADGTYGPTGSGADTIDDVNFTAGSGLINVGAPVLDAYEIFASVITNAADRDLEDDPDGDGIPNGIEFVIGGTPLDGSDLSLLPTAQVVNTDLGNGPTDYLLYSYRSVADAALVDPGVEYDTNLLADPWTFALDGFDGIVIEVMPNGYGEGVDRVDTYLPASLAVDGKLFARLSAVSQN
ncbi:autotransporter-associated beta strand repeat-containing protein [Roseibacillus persicicus]|uniref:autotransporter-associated beta strand repeat-containing protein n=1 Tax=Roseibacillus persicicus TaxID=454148 RepID=UPI00398B518B